MVSFWKRLLIGFGVGGLISNNIVLYIMFLNAYFHDYKTLVLINVYDEAHLEFVMIPVCLGISIVTVCMLLKPYHLIRIRRKDRL